MKCANELSPEGSDDEIVAYFADISLKDPSVSPEVSDSEDESILVERGGPMKVFTKVQKPPYARIKPPYRSTIVHNTFVGSPDQYSYLENDETSFSNCTGNHCFQTEVYEWGNNNDQSQIGNASDTINNFDSDFYSRSPSEPPSVNSHDGYSSDSSSNRNTTNSFATSTTFKYNSLITYASEQNSISEINDLSTGNSYLYPPNSDLDISTESMVSAVENNSDSNVDLWKELPCLDDLFQDATDDIYCDADLFGNLEHPDDYEKPDYCKKLLEILIRESTCCVRKTKLKNGLYPAIQPKDQVFDYTKHLLLSKMQNQWLKEEMWIQIMRRHKSTFTIENIHGETFLIQALRESPVIIEKVYAIIHRLKNIPNGLQMSRNMEKCPLYNAGSYCRHEPLIAQYLAETMITLGVNIAQKYYNGLTIVEALHRHGEYCKEIYTSLKLLLTKIPEQIVRRKKMLAGQAKFKQLELSSYYTKPKITYERRPWRAIPDIREQHRTIVNKFPKRTKLPQYATKKSDRHHCEMRTKARLFELRIDMRNFTPYEVKIQKVSGHRIEISGRHGLDEITARYMIPFDYDINQLHAKFVAGDLVLMAPRGRGPVDYMSEAVFDCQHAQLDRYFKLEDVRPHILQIEQKMKEENDQNK